MQPALLLVGGHLAVEVGRKFHNEDRVLASQPNQHDQANLHKDVHRMVCEQHAADRAQQAQGHAQDDSQRQRPALVQCRQGQEDEDDRQSEDVKGGVAGADLHEHQLCPLRPHTGRQGLLRQCVGVGDSLSRRYAGGDHAGDRGCRVEVVARHQDRALDHADVGQRPERHHLPRCITHLEQMDVVRPRAVLAVRLQRHLPVSAEFVKGVHVDRAKEDVQRLVDVVDRAAQRGGLDPVHVHV